MEQAEAHCKGASKDLLMKNLFKFPKEALLFVQEVARIHEDLKLEEVIRNLIEEDTLEYNMYTLNEEKVSNKDLNRIKRLDLALEFTTSKQNLEFIIFIENQTSNDRAMIFRMLEYITATMLEKLSSKTYDVNKGLPRPIPILIYIGQDNCTMPVQMEEYFKTPQISSVGVQFKTHIVDLGGKHFRQILENTSTPSIFLQLMKALYTNDHEAFEVQRKALYKNLNKQEYEVAQYYKNILGLLATDFVDLFVDTNKTNQGEVERMATTVREILDIDNIIINAQKQGLQEGREEGMQQGMQQGMQHAKEQVAIALLDILEDTIISKKTGLSLEEVIKLRERYQLQH